MSFGTYGELQSEIAGWLHRADMASAIPGFITLGEARIASVLRARFQDSAGSLATTAGVAFATLPTSLLGLDSVSIDGVSASLDYVTPDKLRQDYSESSYSGAPVVYTIIGEQIYFGPVPDDAYTVSLVYSSSVTPLSDLAPTNALLTKWPHVYLTAAMVWACKYTKDLAGAAQWEGDFRDAIGNVNVTEWHSGGPMRVTTDVRF